MPVRTKKHLKREFIQQAYFLYWKLQNNPEYKKLWDRFEKDPTTVSDTRWLKFPSAVRPYPLNVQDGESVNYHSPVDFSKKIDWRDFLQVPDQEIVGLALDYGMLEPIIIAYQPHRFDLFHSNNFLMPVLIDLRYDKKEIFYRLSTTIDIFREGIETRVDRHHTEKFHLYAEVWDLRKGFPKPSFREIARQLSRPKPTVISQFKKAHLLLYNKPYEETIYKATQKALIRKTTCKDCPERASCKLPCGDVAMQLVEIEKRQSHKLGRTFFDKDGKKKSSYEIVADQEAYRKWQEKNFR